MSSANRFFVGGNWKVNGTKDSVKELVSVYNAAAPFPDSVEVVCAPTTLHIGYAQDNLRSDVAVAAQNISTDTGFGAMTGELTAELFAGWGIGWTLTGHSERRRRMQERSKGHDEESSGVAFKTAHALKCGMSVIVCIGETLKDREDGQTLAVCTAQLKEVKDKISVAEWDRIVIAYEPVWAIGTGVSASPEQAQEVHAALRRWLMTELSVGIAEQTRIIYGGSVKPATAAGLIAKDDIDGFLVGGCSLNADFIKIIEAVPKVWDSDRRTLLRERAVSDVQALGADGQKLPSSPAR